MRSIFALGAIAAVSTNEVLAKKQSFMESTGLQSFAGHEVA